jgi:hypothetical protein
MCSVVQSILSALCGDRYLCALGALRGKIYLTQPSSNMTPPQDSPSSSKPGLWLNLFLLSAATLTFEINLTRLFSVAQFYHFAFMIVSIALLGFGASGTALAIFPALLRGDPARRLTQLSLAAGLSILGAYLLTNWIPFDSFSLLVDRRQVFILVLHYLALAAPFFCSGMALGFLLTRYPNQAGTVYGVNLFGSAAGCAIALVAPAALGGEGMVTLSSALAALAALSARWYRLRHVPKHPLSAGGIALLLFALLDLGLRFGGRQGLSIFELHLSPYKSLSYALQYPGAEVTTRQWNSFSRVDVVRSGGIHALPGLSYRYLQPLPALDGLLVDGDDLSPIVPTSADPAFSAYLPNAVAYTLRPVGSTLVLGGRGGLDIVTALAQGHGMVTAVESNPLIVEAVPCYQDARLVTVVESERSYLQRTAWQYDVILLSLASSFHPVQSGAYTLGEDYRYTVEAFQDMLAHLAPDGLLAATRWLQDPSSEDLRLFALAVSALEASGADPRTQIVALRGYNTATVLVKNGAYSPDELATIRQFASSRAYDLSYAPDIQAEETNRYNILPSSQYYQIYVSLLEANPRQAFYDAYEYDVRPPTDDHPFYGHYFKWAQTPQILAAFGQAWLPFGGGGYLVILALLLLAVLLASLLILLPVLVWKRARRKARPAASPFLLRSLLYFGLLGFAFLFIEIPLLQRFILYLGSPAYAVTAVLFALLLFSGVGSRLSDRWRSRNALTLSLGALTLLCLLIPQLLTYLFAWTLGLPLAARLAVTVLALAPLGFLMGMPFPGGLRRLIPEAETTAAAEPASRGDIPWIWAVNGAASVIAPILAALLALSFGFSTVLRLGALCYAIALLTAYRRHRAGALRRPAR